MKDNGAGPGWTFFQYCSVFYTAAEHAVRTIASGLLHFL